MSEALRAMVEAMHAEFRRQADTQGDNACVLDLHAGSATMEGVFDLEKAVRAGLEAIKAAASVACERADVAFDWGPPGYDDAPNGAASSDRVFSFVVDAILGDQP